MFQALVLAFALEMGWMPVDQTTVTGPHYVDVQYYSKSENRWFIQNEMSFKQAVCNVDNAMYLKLNPSVNYKGFDIESNIIPRIVYYNNNLEFVDLTGNATLEYSWNRYSVGSEFSYSRTPDDMQGFARISHKQLRAYVRLKFSTQLGD